ncbi:hypothetical protein M405DRAFT_685145, partial [Rhizopogon salebrosus TDB-379]
LIKQFDLPKDIATDALQSPNSEMARDASSENEATIAENGDGDPDAEDADNEDGWVDEINQLTAHERAAFETNIRPIRLTLAKLRKLAFKIVHSTTLLLPAWKDATKELGLGSRIMPRDVSTRWNSTFDMLEFAINYRKAIDAMTDKRKLGLGVYELDEHEWTLVMQLRDVLKV